MIPKGIGHSRPAHRYPSVGWLCDGLATALMVAGEDGAKYFSQPELVGYQVFVVGRHENTAWSI
jgi:thiamine biosynthesis lipoprotein